MQKLIVTGLSCWLSIASLWAENPLKLKANPTVYESSKSNPDTVIRDLEEGDLDEEFSQVDLDESAEVQECGITYFEMAYDPGFDAEGLFDTVNVNPYQLDLTQKTDTTLIRLQDHHRCDYAHPHKGGITSHFGPRSSTRYHYGIDVGLNIGDPVLCAFEGIVRIARRSASYGNVVMVRHKNGLETIYAHLDRIDVKIGQHIDAGQSVGLGGNTGRSTGPHLHFEVRYKGMPINPAEVINFQQHGLVADSLLIHKQTFAYRQYVPKKTFSTKQFGGKGKSKYYVIRKGDSLSKIARRHKTTVKKICKLNRIKTTSVLKAGRKLRVS